MSSDWCTVESDPGVFSELICSFGVADCEVEEVYSMDQTIDSSHGLIFLFKWKHEQDTRTILNPDFVPNLFFARQVITNACATQAILHVLLNSDSVDLGDKLRDFRQFTQTFDAEMKGEAISNSDMIKNAHNSFARPEPFGFDESKKTSGKGDAYHFIAFVPFGGSVYEIDGLKAGPVRLGDVGEGEASDWLQVAKPAIEERISRYSATETHFALMSIRKLKSSLLEEKIVELEQKSRELEADESREDAAEQLSLIELEIEALRAQLAEDAAKKKFQQEENERRKHNYIPFILKLIETLGEKNVLTGLIGAKSKATHE